MEGVFNTVPLRPVTAPGRLSGGDHVDFPERYVLAQKLEYIRTCRVKHRGNRTRLRLVTDPNIVGEKNVFPRESRRGLPLRKGINKSWDAMRPTSPSMQRDFEIFPGAEQDVRTDFGYRNQTVRPVSPSMLSTGTTGGLGPVSTAGSMSAEEPAEDSPRGGEDRPWFTESIKATSRPGMASTAAARKADYCVFQAHSSSLTAFKRVPFHGDGWNSSTLLDSNTYWDNRIANARGARVGDSAGSIFEYRSRRSQFFDKNSLATTSRATLNLTK